MSVGGRVRRVARWVRNPVVTVAAIVVLAFEVALLPDFPVFSTAGLWLRYYAPRTARGGTGGRVWTNNGVWVRAVECDELLRGFRIRR